MIPVQLRLMEANLVIQSLKLKDKENLEAGREGENPTIFGTYTPSPILPCIDELCLLAPRATAYLLSRHMGEGGGEGGAREIQSRILYNDFKVDLCRLNVNSFQVD